MVTSVELVGLVGPEAGEFVAGTAVGHWSDQRS
jgi:hypothetical protein